MDKNQILSYIQSLGENMSGAQGLATILGFGGGAQQGPTSTQENGTPVFSLANDQVYGDPQQGSFSKVKMPTMQAEDPTKFEMGLIEGRIRRGEGYKDKQLEKYSALAGMLANRQQMENPGMSPEQEMALKHQYDLELEGVKQGGAGKNDQLKNLLSLQDKFTALEPVKNYMTIKGQMEAALAAEGAGSGLPDKELTRIAAKITDPSTGIKDSEEQSFNGGSASDYVKNLLGYVNGGNRLQPGQRQQLMDLIKRRATVGKQNYDQILNNFARIGQPYGVKPEDLDVFGAQQAPMQGPGRGAMAGLQAGNKPASPQMVTLSKNGKTIQVPMDAPELKDPAIQQFIMRG